MTGQFNHFNAYAPLTEVQARDYGVRRYGMIAMTHFDVLDKALEGKQYLVGDEYSIADMAMFPWVRCHSWAGVSIDGLDALAAWIARIDARPAVRRALQLPAPAPRFLAEYDR